MVHARVAGAACAKYVWGDNVKVTYLAALACPGKVEGPKSDKASMGRNSRVVFVLVVVLPPCWAGKNTRLAQLASHEDRSGLLFAGLC